MSEEKAGMIVMTLIFALIIVYITNCRNGVVLVDNGHNSVHCNSETRRA